jgi:hypothetical protein
LAALVSVWMVIVSPGSVALRGLRVGVFAMAVIATVGAYVQLAHAAGGHSGMGKTSGWWLYPRVATFVDCALFKPPEGTEPLCNADVPPERRLGAYYYVWDETSPSRKAFPNPPAEAERLQEFALLAIRNQPLAYLKTVAVDLARYVDPRIDAGKPWAGQGDWALSFTNRQPELEQRSGRVYAIKYTDTTPRIARGEWFLQAYQRIVRVRGWMLAMLAALAVVGATAGRGASRAGAALFGSASLALYVIPVMTFSYDARYGLPALTLMAVAGAMGLSAIVARLGQVRRMTPTPPQFA